MKIQGMITRTASVAAILAAVSASGGAQQIQQTGVAGDPEVSVNIRNERRPDRVINLTATPGSYVTVVRVTPVGRVEVLYPSSPVVSRALIPSSKRVPVPRTPSISNPLAQGSIFAFVSSTPYVYSKVADNNGWNSLHLGNYSAATDAAIAESFGNEIAAPNSRVIMSKATTGPVAIIAHNHDPMVASLASFRNQPCPSTSIPVHNKGGVLCLLNTIGLPTQTVAARSQGPTQTQPTQPPEQTTKK